MTSVTFQWTASEKLIRSELADTGHAERAERDLVVDLADLVSTDMRRRILNLTKVQMTTGPVSLIRINLRQRKMAADERQGYGNYIRTEPVTLDKEPTIDQAVKLAEELAAGEAAALAHQKQIDAAEQAELARLRRVFAEASEQIGALEQAGDLDGLKAYRLPDLPDSGPVRSFDLYRIRDRAMDDLKKARREEDKQAWVNEHGSDYLKRACAGGYDCQRPYVIERAAMEAPDFTVDFYDKAEWKDRACPTSEALDMEDAAKALGIGPVRIVWLVEPPVEDRVEYEYDDFEPCEAVVITKYLDKYTLVQTVR